MYKYLKKFKSWIINIQKIGLMFVTLFLDQLKSLNLYLGYIKNVVNFWNQIML